MSDTHILMNGIMTHHINIAYMNDVIIFSFVLHSESFSSWEKIIPFVPEFSMLVNKNSDMISGKIFQIKVDYFIFATYIIIYSTYR